MANAALDSSIRAVFFDAVGTLLFPAEPVSTTYRKIGRRHNANLDETAIQDRLKKSFQKQERIDADLGWKTCEDREADRWRTIVGETILEASDSVACFSELWEWYRSPQAWTIHPEAETVLNELQQRGLILGMASNFDGRLLGIVDAFSELEALAERCVVSSLVGSRKPSAEFFQHVAAHAGCPTSRILFVGDDVCNDFHGAREAGMHALLLDPHKKVELLGRIERLVEVGGHVF